MITRAHITRRAATDGVPARTVERDYVLAHIIAGLASLERDTGLVFKGGTALRLCHFEDYRYSADLDFSIVAGSREDAYATIEEAFIATGGTTEGLRLTDHAPRKVVYVGLPADVTLPVYTLPEIAGEKIRCILQRLQCRDLFDLSMLLTEGDVDVIDAADIFRPKAEHRGIDPNVFAARYPERLNQYRQRWDAELQEHVHGDVPHFDQLERAVSRELRRAGLL